MIGELNKRTRFHCSEYFVNSTNVTRPTWFDPGVELENYPSSVASSGARSDTRPDARLSFVARQIVATHLANDGLTLAPQAHSHLLTRPVGDQCVGRQARRHCNTNPEPNHDLRPAHGQWPAASCLRPAWIILDARDRVGSSLGLDTISPVARPTNRGFVDPVRRIATMKNKMTGHSSAQRSTMGPKSPRRAGSRHAE